jgi:hypothetical protein
VYLDICLFSHCILFKDKACFICKNKASPLGVIRNECQCPLCPTLPLSIKNPTKLVQHMGTHILLDSKMNGAFNPCGFCLNTGSLCSIRLAKGKGTNGTKTVDVIHSQCSNVAKLSITSAAKCIESSLCTNVPLDCLLCLPGSDAVWKYNLLAHIKSVHPTATLEKYASLAEISQLERTRLKQLFNAKPRASKKKKVVANICISIAHSSQRALE